MFHAHQLHLPNDLRVFHYLTRPVYQGPEALVFDGRASLDAPIFARSYLFRQRWLEIFLTFDHHLHLRADTEDSFPFVFNCDLSTPYVVSDDHGYTIDLFVDVLVAADASTHQIRDRAAFDQAAQTNCIPRSWCDAVERELAWLVHLLDTQQFLPMLNRLTPLPSRTPEQMLSVLEAGVLTEDSFPDLTTYPFATTALLP
jgi:hypothetical protein